jgi:hypothetical protein
MPWDSHNFSIDSGFAVDTEFFSPHFRSSTEYGPLMAVTITNRDSQTSSLQTYISLDGENWNASGSAITASGTVDLTGVRAPFFRWGYKNTTADPGGVSTCEVTIASWLADNEEAINSITTQEQYVYGNFNIAQQMVNGKANTMLVGDSICNDQNGGVSSGQYFKTFFYGALATWRPAVWGQVTIPTIVPTLNAVTGLRYNLNAGATDDGNQLPGMAFDATNDASNPFLPAFVTYPDSLAGACPHSNKVLEITSNIALNSNIYSTGLQKEVWDSSQGTAQSYFFNSTESRYFTDSSGNYTFGVDGGNYVARFVFVVTSDEFKGADAGVLSSLTNEGAKIRIELPESGATDPADTVIDVTSQVPATGSSIVWQDAPFTTTSTFPPTDDLYFRLFGDGNNNANKVIIWPAVVLKRAEQTGLGLTYSGHGGWDITNHAYEYGNPNVVVNPNNDGYTASYKDDALKQWIQANDLDVYAIFLGQNDNRVNLLSEEDLNGAVRDYEILIERYRRIHREAKGNAAKFLIITNYDTTESASNGPEISQLRRSFNDTIINRFKGQRDCLVVDLDGWIRQQFDFGSYLIGENEFADNWLEDGIHPQSLLGSDANLNLYDGADKMMAYVWDRIEYASRNTV